MSRVLGLWVDTNYIDGRPWCVDRGDGEHTKPWRSNWEEAIEATGVGSYPPDKIDRRYSPVLVVPLEML